MKDDILSSFIQAGPPAIRWGGMGITVVLAALWSSLMSILASVLALLFLVELVLGVLRAFHIGGLEAFDWSRFSRGWLKLAAAICGIALSTLGDLLLHESGLPRNLTPLTSAALFGMCWGFFWSATANLSYFFPQVGEWTNAALKRTGHGPDDDVRNAMLEHRSDP